MFTSAKSVSRTCSAIALALGSLAATATVTQAATLYSERAEFEAALEAFKVDDYESPGYLVGDLLNLGLADKHTNASMNAVVNETVYTSTGVPNTNFIVDLDEDNNHRYCAGCDASFRMDFGSTSLTKDGGVLGVGFDIPSVRAFLATVYFTDGSQQDFDLEKGFWGITSDLAISAIHIGGPGGQVISRESAIAGDPDIEIDNLTIGTYTVPDDTGNSQSVPEPTLLLGLGAVGLWQLRRPQRA